MLNSTLATRIDCVDLLVEFDTDTVHVDIINSILCMARSHMATSHIFEKENIDDIRDHVLETLVDILCDRYDAKITIYK